MSRTIRRKGLQDTWPGYWTKAFGYDWEYDGHLTYLRKKTDGTLVFCRHNYGIRERTPREKFDRWYMIHGESSHRNARSPGRFYRQDRENELRSHNKKELYKELNRPGYEGLYWTDPLSCWWDWS